MSGHSKDRLARALEDAGHPHLGLRATRGEFCDVQSEHAFPKTLLVELLRGELARKQGHLERTSRLISRVIAGEFDATREEWTAGYGRSS